MTNLKGFSDIIYNYDIKISFTTVKPVALSSSRLILVPLCRAKNFITTNKKMEMVAICEVVLLCLDWSGHHSIHECVRFMHIDEAREDD